MCAVSYTHLIFLNAYQDGNNVIIEVRDDGNGIDVEAVKKKAIERGTITPEQAENMADKDAAVSYTHLDVYKRQDEGCNRLYEPVYQYRFSDLSADFLCDAHR